MSKRQKLKAASECLCKSERSTLILFFLFLFSDLKPRYLISALCDTFFFKGATNFSSPKLRCATKTQSLNFRYIEYLTYTEQ